MRNLYKRILILTLAVYCSSVSFGLAQPLLSDKSLNQAVVNYSVAIQSDNPGVVMSALYHIMILKKHHPNLKTEPVMDALNNIPSASDNIMKRRAEIVRFFLHNPDLLFGMKEEVLSSPDDFFNLLTKEI